MKSVWRWRPDGWLVTLILLLLVIVGWLALVAALEVGLAGRISWGRLATFTVDTASEVLGGFPEIIIGILGITITVVSITLQLAATRYSHRVTEMFFHDKGNLGVLFFYVLASVHCVAAAALIRNGVVPELFLLSTLVLVTIAVVVLIPYFMYVFAFLDPERLVNRLELQAVNAFLRGRSSVDQRYLRDLQRSQLDFRGAVEQLSDVAIHALSKLERSIASTTTEALKQVAITYLGQKNDFPETWFKIDPPLRHSPELQVMASKSVQSLEENRCWVEWMILSQLATIYTGSLNLMRDISRRVAINTRQLAAYALQVKDEPVLNLTIRFFNSYLRSAINRKDVRSGYNVFDQYRHLAEVALVDDAPETAIQISGYMNYYGNLAIKSGLPFLAETAAFDLTSLCIFAHEHDSDTEFAILRELISLGNDVSYRVDKDALRGVRKAQIKLATYYLSVGLVEPARSIAAEFEHVDADQLGQIIAALDMARQSEFWEVIDRGQNFDYLPNELHDQLPVFREMTSSMQLKIEV